MKTLATGLKRGEEPRWKEGAVWISDRLGRRLWQVGAAGAVFTEVPVTSNGLWALSGGGLAGATLAEKRIGIWDGARWAEHVDLSPLAPEPPGDMVAMPWAISMSCLQRRRRRMSNFPTAWRLSTKAGRWFGRNRVPPADRF